MTLPSARLTVLRAPNGAPFRAGMNVTVNCSPILSAFGPTLVIPRSASAVAEPVVWQGMREDAKTESGHAVQFHCCRASTGDADW